MADQFSTATIEGVTREAPNRPYNIRTDDGVYTTFKDPIGAQAMSMIGQRADLTYYIKTREYVNRNGEQVQGQDRVLTGLAPATAPAPAGQPGGVPSSSPPGPPASRGTVRYPDEYQRAKQPEEELAIMRQNAAGHAVNMLPHLDPEARTLDTVILIAEKLVAFYRGGREQV